MSKNPRRNRIKNKQNTGKNIVSRILTPSVSRGKISITVTEKFNDFIITGSLKNIKNNLPRLLENNAIRNSLGAYRNEIQDIGAISIFNNLNPDKYLYIYAEVILSMKSSINDFIDKRINFENFFLTGNYDKALLTLESIYESHGFSMWYIRNKILTYAYSNKIDELSNFVDETRAMMGSEIFADYVKGYFWVSQSNDPIVTLEKAIINGTKELSDANVKEWAALQSLLFFPQWMYDICNIEESLKLLQLFPYVDLYVLLIDVIGYQITNGSLDTERNSTKKTTIEIIEKITPAINDQTLRSIYHGLRGEEKYHLCEIGTEIISNYNIGEYEKSIDIYFENFSKIFCPTAYLNIISKCYAYLKPENKVIPNTPIGSLVKDFCEVYLLQEGISQNVYHIKGSIIKLHGLSSSASIYTALTKLVPYAFERDSVKKINFYTLLTQKEATPLTEALARDTPYYFDVEKHPEIKLDDKIANYRERRHSIIKRFSESDSVPNFDEIISELKNDPLKKDMYETVSQCLSGKNNNTKLLEFVATSLIEEHESYVCFPLMKIAAYIEEKNVVSLDSIIILSFLYSNISNEKEYLLNESLEDYLIERGVEKPSQLLIDGSTISEKEKYFFYKVCVPDVMDFLSVFESSLELKEERLKIIAWFYGASKVDKKKLTKEIEVLISEIIIDENASKVERSKIVINNEAIKRKKIADIEALIDLYEHSDDKNNRDRFIPIKGESDDSMETAVISGGKNTIIARMLNQLIPVYLYDDDLGLDKSLSAEIRHGFFANLIRSRAEDRNIITELDEQGQYKNNIYWRDFYLILHPTLLSGIDSALKDFSRKLNDKIDEAEEWMKVCTEGEFQNRVFDYTINSLEFENLKQIIERTKDPEQITDAIIKILNKKTETNIEKIRDKLNIEFKQSIDTLCDELISSIEDIKGVAQLNELTGSIRILKNEMNSDITTVSEWFCVSEKVDHENMPLDFLIDTAVTCFKKIRGASANIVVDSGKGINVDGRFVKSLIIVLINLLNNSLDYGVRGEQTEVILNYNSSGKNFNFEVINKISKYRSSSLLNGNLDKIISKMRSPSSSSFLREEGGTGLCKSYNKLKGLDDRFDVNPEVSEGNFIVRVSYGI